jgi:hypothetical protein
MSAGTLAAVAPERQHREVAMLLGNLDATPYCTGVEMR